jgi:hypothetical protein
VALVVGGSGTADPEPLMGATITSIYSSGISGLTGLPDTNGVYFQAVPGGSYAASQGFMANDVIRQINGITVTSKQSFWTNYVTAAPGSPVSLVLWRDAVIQPFTFTKTTGDEELDETSGTIFNGTGWLVQSNSSCFNSDIHYTKTNGDYFQLTFYGSGIDFLSEMHSDQDMVDVYIDGAYDQTISCYLASGRLYQQAVYSKRGLTPGVHTIKGIKDDSSYMILDAFIVHQPPAVSGAGILPGHNFALAFSGSSGQNYQVLTSTNLLLPLTNWLVLTNGILDTGLMNYTDSTATNVQQYYRIVSPP